MKKKTRMLIIPLLFAVGLFGGLSVLGSCASTGGSSSANNTSSTTSSDVSNEESAVILSVDGASVDSNTNEIFMVVNKDTDSVSLENRIVCSTNSTWKLYYDKLGQMEIPTKIAAGMSGILNNGENVFYIVVSSAEGDIVNVYTLKIHRSYAIYLTYSFQAVTLKTESVFSGYEISLDYTPEIKGYTFLIIGWISRIIKYLKSHLLKVRSFMPTQPRMNIQ